MDIIYYSKFCKYCDNVLQYIVRNNLTDRFSFINVDKRSSHPKTNQIIVHLDNGSAVSLPPNVVHVPSLCLVSQKYTVLVGNKIIEYLEPIVKNRGYTATQMNGEPSFFSFGSSGLPSIGGGGSSMFSPTLNDNEGLSIITPPEDYKSSRMTDEMASNAVKMMQDDMNQYAPKQPAYTNMPPPASVQQMNMHSPINNFQGISYNLNL